MQRRPGLTPDELIDPDALRAYLDQSLPGPGDLEIRRHQAGHSNETFFVRRGPDEWVLRRPPRGAFLPTAHDVSREFRVLAALGPTAVRVPEAVLICTDVSVIGAPFYLMERVRGSVIRTMPPPAFTEDERGGLGRELVDAIVELHSVDPAACGLEDFGRPDGYLERQLRRWTGQLELTMPFTRPLPDLERVGRWLGHHLPGTQRTTLVHGDYKLDNVMFAATPPARLVAILDWEMSTRGDPLADLGWMISFWREPDGEELTSATMLPGFSSRDELIEQYAAATGLDVSPLRWYEVLAVWKLAIILEGSYARHLAGAADDPFFAGMEHAVPVLAARAVALSGG